MTPVVRFVLGAALLLVVVAIGGAAALVWPFLAALHVSPWEALRALIGVAP